MERLLTRSVLRGIRSTQSSDSFGAAKRVAEVCSIPQKSSCNLSKVSIYSSPGRQITSFTDPREASQGVFHHWQFARGYICGVSKLGHSRTFQLPQSERSEVCLRSFSVAAAADDISAPVIDTVLIANRGEIACRVIRTAKRLGVRTVAVYSEADAQAEHVRQADEAICIGPAASSKSYLRGDKILEAALRTGAKAVHPGYGFLSENAEFARQCAEAGVEFIGPPASAIEAMGSKSAAKALMSAAGVPVVPGYHGSEQAPEFLEKEAEKTGYPVMIKAVQGGGGKGMRIVENASQFRDALASAQREAMSSFGDSRVLIERYLPKPRHIEVQIFGDKHGNAVHLFERDCSVQRRHQKVIEEAPAPGVTPEFRKRIGGAAVDAAKAVGYVGAGTVEFIVDPETMEFFFMEMNTRLQVEHPVTEMVTGTDLVEWQLRVAAGERIPLLQDGIQLQGHAFETRIYAENVPRGFLPAAGRLHHLRTPSDLPGAVRVETGVREGDVISTYYDPMIAKLVVWGKDRGAALVKLRQALGEYQIAGMPTNVPFLKALAAHPSFSAGDVDTGFIGRHRAALIPERLSEEGATAPAKPLYEGLETGRVYTEGEKEALAVAAVGLCLQERVTLRDDTLWSAAAGVRLNTGFSQPVALQPVDEAAGPGDLEAAAEHVTVAHNRDGSFQASFGDHCCLVKAQLDAGDVKKLRVEVDGHAKTATIARFEQGGRSHLHLWLGGAHYHFTVPKAAPWEEDGDPLQRHGKTVTPMPGRVVKVVAAKGALLKKGDPILILEAMKMEHIVRAPMEGLLEALAVKEGQQVEEGAWLFEMKESIAPVKL
ncbi:hypothetical protein KFL_005850010 [Klebsormidium nitens]|uniref:Uncharacterized protein n=1 Tax=Klebsormidium nitens TaxID=105231 RepID=A0A1Y1IMF8_KLENI|nr:hypothetical protein KFL_005850010 [Klebsormidium nitens]|eukprot:GAQ89976.1 hypothetical protein KFL_005850010 [Klebsormidium nitens]